MKFSVEEKQLVKSRREIIRFRHSHKTEFSKIPGQSRTISTNHKPETAIASQSA